LTGKKRGLDSAPFYISAINKSKLDSFMTLNFWDAHASQNAEKLKRNKKYETYTSYSRQ